MYVRVALAKMMWLVLDGSDDGTQEDKDTECANSPENSISAVEKRNTKETPEDDLECDQDDTHTVQ